MNNLITKSKWLSYVLRHNPESIGIALEDTGWANVDDILRTGNITIGELTNIVANDDKGRYSFSDDMKKIRANQGHSVKIKMFQKEEVPPDYLYHGTTLEAWNNNIKYIGLLKQSRLHVHLTEDITTARKNAERWKNKTPIVLKINAFDLSSVGAIFYKSDNNVWLVDSVSVKYINII